MNCSSANPHESHNGIPPELPVNSSVASTGRQHYATFAVELLLSADDRVRRTRVTHVQSGVIVSWAGWRPTELMAFLAQRGGLPSEP